MPTPTPPPEPLKPKPHPQPPKPSHAPKPLNPVDKKDEFLLKSPFAKMFERTGMTPTAKEMRAIINGILKQQIDEIKRQDAGWKRAMKKIKEAIEGND